MNQRIMELAREAQVAISRRELDELLQAEQDYTRAVISERDELKADITTFSDRISELENNSLEWARDYDVVCTQVYELTAERDLAIQLGKSLEEQRDQLRKELAELRNKPIGLPACPDCHAPDVMYECVWCSATNYPPKAEPVQEPVAWRMRNTSFRGLHYEYYTNKEAAELRQADFNRSVDDGGLHDLTPLYAAPQDGLRTAAQMALDCLDAGYPITPTSSIREALRKELGQ